MEGLNLAIRSVNYLQDVEFAAYLTAGGAVKRNLQTGRTRRAEGSGVRVILHLKRCIVRSGELQIPTGIGVVRKPKVNAVEVVFRNGERATASCEIGMLSFGDGIARIAVRDKGGVLARGRRQTGEKKHCSPENKVSHNLVSNEKRQG